MNKLIVYLSKSKVKKEFTVEAKLGMLSPLYHLTLVPNGFSFHPKHVSGQGG